jgi:hypothetical protein
MMTRRPLALFALIPLAALIGVCVGWIIPHGVAPTKPPNLLDQLRAMDMAAREQDFALWVAHHPDIPRTIEFPEIPGDPVLWDFTRHAVLLREKRTWTWGDIGYVTGTSMVISSATSVALSGSTSTYTCSYPTASTFAMPIAVPAGSGGYP